MATKSTKSPGDRTYTKLQTKWDEINYERLTREDFYDVRFNPRPDFLIPAGVVYPNERSMLKAMNQMQQGLRRGRGRQWRISSPRANKTRVVFLDEGEGEGVGERKGQRVVRDTERGSVWAISSSHPERFRVVRIEKSSSTVAGGRGQDTPTRTEVKLVKQPIVVEKLRTREYDRSGPSPCCSRPSTAPSCDTRSGPPGQEPLAVWNNTSTRLSSMNQSALNYADNLEYCGTRQISGGVDERVSPSRYPPLWNTPPGQQTHSGKKRGRYTGDVTPERPKTAGGADISPARPREQKKIAGVEDVASRRAVGDLHLGAKRRTKTRGQKTEKKNKKTLRKGQRVNELKNLDKHYPSKVIIEDRLEVPGLAGAWVTSPRPPEPNEPCHSRVGIARATQRGKFTVAGQDPPPPAPVPSPQSFDPSQHSWEEVEQYTRAQLQKILETNKRFFSKIESSKDKELSEEPAGGASKTPQEQSVAVRPRSESSSSEQQYCFPSYEGTNVDSSSEEETDEEDLEDDEEDLDEEQSDEEDDREDDDEDKGMGDQFRQEDESEEDVDKSCEDGQDEESEDASEDYGEAYEGYIKRDPFFMGKKDDPRTMVSYDRTAGARGIRRTVARMSNKTEKLKQFGKIPSASAISTPGTRLTPQDCGRGVKPSCVSVETKTSKVTPPSQPSSRLSRGDTDSRSTTSRRTVDSGFAVKQRKIDLSIELENRRLAGRLFSIRSQPSKNSITFRNNRLEQLPFARIQKRLK